MTQTSDMAIDEIGPSPPGQGPIGQRNFKALRPSRSNLTLLLLMASVVLADFLFWSRSAPGLSLVLFLVGLAIFQAINCWQRLTVKSLSLGAAILAVSVLPLLEAPEFLSTLFAVFGTALSCLILRGTRAKDWIAWASKFARATLVAPAGLPIFLMRSRYGDGQSGWLKSLLGWSIPLALSAVFVSLFANANPVWQQWIEAIDIEWLLEAIFSTRSLFWVFMVAVALPFISLDRPKTIARKWFNRLRSNEAVIEPKNADGTVQMVLRCLILFNVVFGLQTGIDVLYLWGGVGLPEGMTYASYAHRGAYPLVAAALLAGALVVSIMRPGGVGEQSKLAKWLVFLWVGQNLMLLASSVLRLGLYIEVYALTYWRLAALIWMALVAAGLVTIVVRFATGRTTQWMVGTNFLILLVTLYITSLTNFPGIIADYNLNRDIAAHRMDFRYVGRLGVRALPAVLDRLQSDRPLSANNRNALLKCLRSWSDPRKQAFWYYRDWREWSFGFQRVKWYAEANESEIKALLKQQHSLKKTRVKKPQTPLKHSNMTTAP